MSQLCWSSIRWCMLERTQRSSRRCGMLIRAVHHHWASFLCLKGNSQNLASIIQTHSVLDVMVLVINWFQVRLGKNGVEEVLDLGPLSDFEKQGLEALKPELKSSIEKGVKFANQWVKSIWVGLFFQFSGYIIALHWVASIKFMCWGFLGSFPKHIDENCNMLACKVSFFCNNDYFCHNQFKSLLDSSYFCILVTSFYWFYSFFFF